MKALLLNAAVALTAAGMLASCSSSESSASSGLRLVPKSQVTSYGHGSLWQSRRVLGAACRRSPRWRCGSPRRRCRRTSHGMPTYPMNQRVRYVRDHRVLAHGERAGRLRAHERRGTLLKYGAVRSAAADWSVYPVGTTFKIKGLPYTYVVDDYGSALVGTNTIDIFHPSLQSMREWATRNGRDPCGALGVVGADREPPERPDQAQPLRPDVCRREAPAWRARRWQAPAAHHARPVSGLAAVTGRPARRSDHRAHRFRSHDQGGAGRICGAASRGVVSRDADSAGSPDPFTLLVAVLLSAQCTDVRVNQVTPALFALADHAGGDAPVGVDAINAIVRPCGLAPRKAQCIARALRRSSSTSMAGRCPPTSRPWRPCRAWATRPPRWSWRRPSGCPAFPVDTHIHRLAQRWKLTSGSSVAQTERDLKRLFPKDLWNQLHLQIIFYGREHCTARGCDGTVCEICRELVSRAPARRARHEKLSDPLPPAGSAGPQSLDGPIPKLN